jgi:hypothetical protein
VWMKRASSCWCARACRAPAAGALRLARFAPAFDDMCSLLLAQRPESRDGCKMRCSRARPTALPQVNGLPRGANQKTDFLRRQPQPTPMRRQSLGTESTRSLRRSDWPIGTRAFERLAKSRPLGWMQCWAWPHCAHRASDAAG